jgi:TonB family protein
MALVGFFLSGAGMAQGLHWNYGTRITQRYDVAPGVRAPAAPAFVAVPYPQYPFEMARAGLDGKVLVQFKVTPAGRAEEIKLVSATFQEFGDAAIEAVKAWRFRPLADNGPGYPANVLVQASFDFESHPFDPPPR